jgi:hypothetical protein
MVAIVGVDAELVDELERVLASVLDVDEGVVEGRAVIAREAVDLTEGTGGGEDIGGNDLVEQTFKLAIGEGDAVAGLEGLAEVGFEGSAVANVWAMLVFQVEKLRDQGLFKLTFP